MNFHLLQVQTIKNLASKVLQRTTNLNQKNPKPKNKNQDQGLIPRPNNEKEVQFFPNNSFFKIDPGKYQKNEKRSQTSSSGGKHRRKKTEKNEFVPKKTKNNEERKKGFFILLIFKSYLFI